jgi:hypothetical protein
MQSFIATQLGEPEAAYWFVSIFTAMVAVGFLVAGPNSRALQGQPRAKFFSAFDRRCDHLHVLFRHQRHISYHGHPALDLAHDIAERTIGPYHAVESWTLYGTHAAIPIRFSALQAHWIPLGSRHCFWTDAGLWRTHDAGHAIQ